MCFLADLQPPLTDPSTRWPQLINEILVSHILSDDSFLISTRTNVVEKRNIKRLSTKIPSVGAYE